MTYVVNVSFVACLGCARGRGQKTYNYTANVEQYGCGGFRCV